MPLGLTLIEAQKYARRAEQLAVLKTFAEGELLRRLPFRNLVGGSLSFPAETKLPRVGFRAVNEGYREASICSLTSRDSSLRFPSKGISSTKSSGVQNERASGTGEMDTSTRAVMGHMV